MGTPWKPQTDLFVKPTLNLWEFSKPTIAQVHGYCVGGGTHYGLTTDIVIASEDAYFSVPAAAGVRHAVRGVLDRAVGLHELAPRGVLPVPRRRSSTPRGRWRSAS